MRKAYYEGTIKEDIQNVNKIKSFNKRETVITAGASLLGLASYGILKTYGYDDMVSNYPLMAYYALVFVEGKLSYTKYLKSKARLEGLMDDLTDKKEELMESLLKAKTGKAEYMSRSEGNSKLITVDDFYVGNVDNISIIRQDLSVCDNGDGKLEKVSSITTYSPEEAKVILRTR